MKTLDNDEQSLMESFENEEWISTPDIELRRKELSEYAADTIRKEERVNIRISVQDLRQLQRIALREGLPYQTLISSVLHKYVNGHLA